MRPSIREELEAREDRTLVPAAARSRASRGRRRPEPEDDVRPAFLRDRPGDHYRTRLTHTLEVAQIARTIARALALNEELTEAVALGHDLGHTPFGHQGERVLAALVPGGFDHCAQSLRIVDVLERDGEGLNLTWEVRDGIAKHSKGKRGAPVGPDVPNQAATLEGQVARLSDLVAYVNHDIDDARRAGLLTDAQLPDGPLAVLGRTHSTRIGTLVRDVVEETRRTGTEGIRMSAPVLEALLDLRAFMFASVYENARATAEFQKASGIMTGLWERVRARPDAFLDPRTLEAEGLDAAARDFLAGMTDRYAIALFERLFIPRPWVDLGGPFDRAAD